VTIQLLAKRSYHAIAEATTLWRLNGRAAFFGPCQSQPLSFVVNIHVMSILPAGTDSAPNFVVFVHSSLSVKARLAGAMCRVISFEHGAAHLSDTVTIRAPRWR
jgi:hypothetical protein